MAAWGADGLAGLVLLAGVLAVVLGAVLAGAFGTVSAQSPPPGAAAPGAEERPPISGDPAKPRRHFRLRNPASLDSGEAEAVYRALKSEMAANYRLSGDPVAGAYRGWRRFNRAPYRSSAHGNRYLNNYGNAAARAYGRFEEAGRLPVGAVIAKDSFTVTGAGDVHPGPLFIMEKMAKGFKYVTGDWRYTMIMPDGSVFGATDGPGSEKVEFCIACHLAREKTDHLFFIPEAARAGG